MSESLGIPWKPCDAAPPQESCGQCMYGLKQASEQSSRIGVQFEVNLQSGA